MKILELLAVPDNEDITDASRTLYQRKIGSPFFAAIATRPDIEFAVHGFCNSINGQESDITKRQTDCFIICFKRKIIAFVIGENAQDLSSFVCANNASFGDNKLYQKSFQGYLMKLFGRAVAWRANKQDTITTLSIEAEILSISQTAKEAIYLSRLMQPLNLVIPEAVTIEFDSTQIIRLLVDKSMELQSKLQHVDIYSHWVRQKLQRGSIHIRYVPTKEMVAGSLTRAISSAQKHDSFLRMTGIEDQKDLLSSIKGKKDTLQQLRTDLEYSEVYVFGADATGYVDGFFC